MENQTDFRLNLQCNASNKCCLGMGDAWHHVSVCRSPGRRRLRRPGGASTQYVAHPLP